MNMWNSNDISYEYLNNFYLKFREIFKKYGLITNVLDENLNLLKENIDVHKEKYAYVNKLLNFLLQMEFGIKSLEMFSGADINFKSTNGDLFEFNIEFKSDEVYLKSNIPNPNFKINKVIYIDSMHTLGFKIENLNNEIKISNQSGSYHLLSILENLVKKNTIPNTMEITYTKLRKKFENELIEIMGGYFEYDHENNEFIFNTKEGKIDLINVASGYKQLGLIQLLLSNETLRENTCLIIDEPELNLHPSIQIKFAELLVKIANKLNVIVYINTHSPIFIEAIETFCESENMIDKTNFYLCKFENQNTNNIKKINKEEIDKIYENLTYPYQILESIKFENNWKNEFY